LNAAIERNGGDMSIATPNRPHCKLALWLGAAGLLAQLALFPYVFQVMPQALAASRKPLWLLVSLLSVQAGLQCFAFAWLGLYLGASLGLDAPWLRALVYRRPVQSAAPARWRSAVLLGVLLGLLTGAVAVLWPGPPVGSVAAAGAFAQAWRGALAGLYGGIVEEIMCRLMLMTLLVWLLSRWHRRQAWMYATAALLAAVLFGVGHLPAALAVGMHTPMQLGRIVLLNAMPGVIFGWLFWKHGLEHAMVAHLSTDAIVHALLPLALS
jgi:membrane protease YdiL (CAAX protease family)